MNRKAQVTRRSKETQLTVDVLLEGKGTIAVNSGLAFLDHMLEQVARYGGFDLKLRGSGDVHVDPHHLVAPWLGDPHRAAAEGRVGWRTADVDRGGDVVRVGVEPRHPPVVGAGDPDRAVARREPLRPVRHPNRARRRTTPGRDQERKAGEEQRRGADAEHPTAEHGVSSRRR